MATSEVTGVTTGQPNLVKQDLSTLDVSKLSAVSKEVISRQATINIGTIGHVAHGKSTVVKAISGVQTVRFKNELERNITIKLDQNRKRSMGQRFFKNGKNNDLDENTCVEDGLIKNTDNNSGNKNHIDFESITSETTFNTKPESNDRKLRVRNKPTEENILKNILRNVKRRRSSEFAKDEEKIEPPKKKLKKVDTLDSQNASNDISTANCCEEKSFDIDEEKINEEQTTQRQNKLTEPVEQTKTIDCSLELSNGTKTNEENLHENSTDSVISMKTYANVLKSIPLAKEPKVMINPLLSKDLTSNKNTKIDTYKNEYIVENIIAQKVDKGSQLFLVKWKGWSAKYNSWEPLAHLDNCPLILAQFVNQEYKNRHEELAKLRYELSSPETLTLSALETLMKEPGTLKPPDEIELLRSLIALLDIPIEERDPLEISRIKRLIRISELHKKRSEQLELLKEWENEINVKETTQGKIRVENNVDLEMPPRKFIYSNEYVPGKGVTIPNDPPIGCECKICNYRSKNCCAEQGGGICYNSKKLIKVAPGAPVYECNKRCKCNKSCQNRVVQNGGTVPLCIFRTDNDRGWGVKAEKRIPTGKFICMYVGEVILFEEAERRGQIYDAMGRTYLFDLDFNSSDHPYTVDAATYGNISHFINHSCDPNLGVWAIWIDCLDPNLPSLALFAKRDIEKDEELTFDYMARSTHEPDSNLAVATDANLTKQRVRLDLPENERESLVSRTRCKCGAKTCRQYLF